MFRTYTLVLLCFLPVLFQLGTCAVDNARAPYLSLYSPGDPEYTDVLVKRVDDNLTLVCELQGDSRPRMYVWNYVGGNASHHTSDKPYATEPLGPSTFGKLTKYNLQLSDSGHYMCSSPPFSVTKYILVQDRGPKQCARGAFWCGRHCVLAAYVCDGFNDCKNGEDEAVQLCAERPCNRADKLNCSSGRCISEAACCRARSPRCQHPSCCDEHPRYSTLEGGYMEVEYPPLYEDRHAPDEYGFIQSTIYTVTACALIFMIAVVLLVSAICKMHMKRAALRGYAHADRAARQHYNMHYAQAQRFPPCYEASRLLEQAANNVSGITPTGSPTRQPLQCNASCPPEESPDDCPQDGSGDRSTGFGLARLSSIFTSRYRQVPTMCTEVELRSVHGSPSASANSSPLRRPNNNTQPPLQPYRSPTYADLNAEVFLDPELSSCGRDLNYMSTPLELYRRRTLHVNRPRQLTLQLGRFQLSIPRLGRRTSTDRRPDTPNIAELNIDDLDFVRLNSNETYTLNGRTIRLLGANFENYPVLNDNLTTTVRPPPYTEAMRYKLYGPPPEYLSRDALNNETTEITVTEQQARNNVEMPPCYDELATDRNGNNDNGPSSSQCNVTSNGNITNNVTNNDNLTVIPNLMNNVTVTNNVTNNDNLNVISSLTNNVTVTNNVTNNDNVSVIPNLTNHDNSVLINATVDNVSSVTDNIENISSVIDNLPAIDSDVNANDTERYNATVDGDNVNNN